MSKPKQEHLIDIPDHLIKELLTDSEKRMVKQRLLIINLLEERLSIRKVAIQAKVGTDTVVRVARMIEKGNLRKILDEARKEDKNTSTWIFGKSED